MASKRLYWYVEILSMTAGQRSTLIEGIKGWGDRNGDGNPANRNHWRVRADSQAVIFEAWIEENNLSVFFFRQQLAALFGVALANVTGSAVTNAFGSQATFQYGGVDRLRVGVFGGVGANVGESQAAARAFLAANGAAWGDI
jgi:hypothetical protein